MAIDFPYTEDFQSISFYMDNDVYCSVDKSDIPLVDGTYTFDCTADEIATGWHMFTLTASVDGVETTHSPGFQWMKKPADIGHPKTIRITIGTETIEFSGK